jgi:hypothetical protein
MSGRLHTGPAMPMILRGSRLSDVTALQEPGDFPAVPGRVAPYLLWFASRSLLGIRMRLATD